MQHIQHANAESLDLFLSGEQKRVQKVCFEIVIPSSQFVFSFDGNSVVDEPTAIHTHTYTSLGVYDGSPFALGGCCFDWENNKVEHFTDSWRSLGQFPFGYRYNRYIWAYSTVTVKNVLYIFGKFNCYSPRFISAHYSAHYFTIINRIKHFLFCYHVHVI